MQRYPSKRQRQRENQDFLRNTFPVIVPIKLNVEILNNIKAQCCCHFHVMPQPVRQSSLNWSIGLWVWWASRGRSLPMTLSALTLRLTATLSSSPSNLRTQPPITTDTGRKGGWESVKEEEAEKREGGCASASQAAKLKACKGKKLMRGFHRLIVLGGDRGDSWRPGSQRHIVIIIQNSRITECEVEESHCVCLEGALR